MLVNRQVSDHGVQESPRVLGVEPCDVRHHPAIGILHGFFGFSRPKSLCVRDEFSVVRLSNPRENAIVRVWGVWRAWCVHTHCSECTERIDTSRLTAVNRWHRLLRRSWTNLDLHTPR